MFLKNDIGQQLGLDEARQDKTEAEIPKYLSEVRIFKIKVTFIDAQAAKPSGAVKGQGGG